jgi:hypothetical protein
VTVVNVADCHLICSGENRNTMAMYTRFHQTGLVPVRAPIVTQYSASFFGPMARDFTPSASGSTLTEPKPVVPPFLPQRPMQSGNHEAQRIDMASYIEPVVPRRGLRFRDSKALK